VKTGAKVTKAEKGDGKVKATIEGKDGKTETLEVDRVISAVGVVGNIEDLGLEGLGV
jgi:dihydrolipoamide dehydrogenase